MAGTFPDVWSEVCLVTISMFKTSPITLEASALTETVDLPQGDYPGESIPNLAGGRIWKQSPEEDGEITLEIYPVSLTIDTDTTPDTIGGIFQFFAGETSTETIDSTTPTNPLATAVAFTAGVSRVRARYRVAVMWTDDAAVTSAESATSSTDSVALRFAAMGCRLVSHKASFTDGVLKVTATFKYPAMNKAGDTRMWRWESTNDGDTTPMTALPSYDDEDSWT